MRLKAHSNDKEVIEILSSGDEGASLQIHSSLSMTRKRSHNVVEVLDEEDDNEVGTILILLKRILIIMR
jgi:hypothetical protein